MKNFLDLRSCILRFHLSLLNDLYVDTEARKQGVGEMLLNKAKDFAIETGAKSLSLSTAPDNFSAQRLYEKNGYEKDTEFYHYELNLTKC